MRRYIPGRPQLHCSMLAGAPNAKPALDDFQQQDVWLTLKARTAIYRAAQLTGLSEGGEVLVPSYHCGSEVDALIKAGAALRFYRIDATAHVDLADLERKITSLTKAIYVIHYFGIAPPLPALRALCDRHGLWLLEDRALTSLRDRANEQDEPARGDLVIYSFAKPLPVPDGGALMVHHPGLASRRWSLRPAASPVSLGLLLKRSAAAKARRWSHRRVNRPLPEGGAIMPSGYHFDSSMEDAAISNDALRMLWRVDASGIANACRGNFALLHEALRPALKRPRRLSALAPGACPLIYPLLVENRSALLARLHERGIEAMPFWAGYHPDFPLREFPDARRLKDGLAGLPIHQDLDERDMRYVADETLRALELL